MPRTTKPKTWITVTIAGGRTGRYEVTAGMITVDYKGQRKTTHASSANLPKGVDPNADASLARLMLSEFSD